MSRRRRCCRIVGSRSRAREREREEQEQRRISWFERSRALSLSFFFSRFSLSLYPLFLHPRSIELAITRSTAIACHITHIRAGMVIDSATKVRRDVVTPLRDDHRSSSGNETAAALRHRSAYATEEQVCVRRHWQSVFECECECVNWVRRALFLETRR